MEAIEAVLPPADGFACFNRMYLDVTRQVNSRLGQGFFADPAFMTRLDVTFANLYFAAADPAAVPLAWRPLAERRATAGIEPVQFALSGMNSHINHDLPLAIVSTCAALATAPGADSHLAQGLDEKQASAAFFIQRRNVAVKLGDRWRTSTAVPDLDYQQRLACRQVQGDWLIPVSGLGSLQPVSDPLGDQQFSGIRDRDEPPLRQNLPGVQPGGRHRLR